MKNFYTKRFLLATFGLLPLCAEAYDFMVGSYCYNVIKAYEVEVTYKTIGDYHYHSGTVEIPSTVTYRNVDYKVTRIGDWAFYNNFYIDSVIIPNSVTSIGKYAFGYIIGLSSVTIPSSVTSIGEYAFMESTGLTSVNIPSSVTSIGSYAFKNIDTMTDITLPEGIDSIYGGAFYGCTSLMNVTIPSSVSYLGGSEFEGCWGLISVTFSEGLTAMINGYMFKGCYGIADVYCPNATPPTLVSWGFETSTYESATLHVPIGSVEDYSTASGWQKFSTIVDDLVTADIGSVKAETDDALPVGYYSLSGQRIDAPAKDEVIIIRMSDGTSRKVLVK